MWDRSKAAFKTIGMYIIFYSASSEWWYSNDRQLILFSSSFDSFESRRTAGIRSHKHAHREQQTSTHRTSKLLYEAPGRGRRMLETDDADFQGLILIFFNGLWKFHTQPSDWQLSLLQPINKGHNKVKTDPASYRGINFNDTLDKLFEGLLIARLTTHTELLNTLTDSQLGTKPNMQTHDAIYCFFAII